MQILVGFFLTRFFNSNYQRNTANPCVAYAVTNFQLILNFCRCNFTLVQTFRYDDGEDTFRINDGHYTT